ncbi:MAG TPA: T9SS type A sorting domain-containing protein [Bacteroidales bacterium]|nr:T9SS type A sorting domain-containing protein [Bacteroidales bacterium]HOK97535.1 T9SS type A sorting domain-containing protein [Bacteroidales bacterium]HPO64355.1 T9SS type A sorting domain-containing protein [Bacteroidales bacterium]
MKNLMLTLCAVILLVFSANSQEVTSNYYGIFTDNPNILVRLPIDDVRGHIYVWENTLSGLITDPYEGEGCLAFRSTGVGWWGFGIHDDSAVSLSHFQSGFLIFSVKTSAKDEFSIHVYGANKTEAKIVFPQNGGPQNFKRNGEWQKITFPIADLVAQGLDLSSVPIPFAAIGGNISNIAFDDIFYSVDSAGPNNPVAHPQPKPVDNTNVKTQEIPAQVSLSRGTLNISASMPISKITVTDITGKIMVNNHPRQYSLTLDVAKWVKGIYLITIYSNTGKVFTEKILIQ